METVPRARLSFNRNVAPRLARAFKAEPIGEHKWSKRFAYFSTSTRFVIVAGRQEGRDVDRALAYGTSLRAGKKLTLVLPEGHLRPTIQRTPWLTPADRPDVFAHNGTDVREVSRLSQEETIAELRDWLDPQTPADELRKAMAPAYFGSRSSAIEELVNWAGDHPLLDPAHRRGSRGWQYMGQRVLSVNGTSGGLVVRAGIHYADSGKVEFVRAVGHDESLRGESLADAKEAIAKAIELRQASQPDEHWIQAAIRRDPSCVGVEQPALREVPAWRPVASPKEWGRGFIDLMGLDGAGDIRIIETKLAANSDDMLVFQGLDYYVWARAYLDVLKERLGAAKRAGLVVHYVIGATQAGTAKVSPYAAAHARSLDIPWRFQVVKGWVRRPGDLRSGVTASLLSKGQLPVVAKAPLNP